MGACVALIDDDPSLTSLLSEYLISEGFDVLIAENGNSGTKLALSGLVDIVVLDIMMPKQSGIDTLREIRKTSNIPVLMLTGRGDSLDRISGLELGADDYIPKPCLPRELVARIRAVLKRTRSDELQTHPLKIENLVLKPGERRAELNGTTLLLTSTEYGLLEYLVRHAGQVVSKKQLSEEVLGRPLSRFDRSIDMHISSLRQKLGLRSNHLPWIETVVRQGYQFIKA